MAAKLLERMTTFLADGPDAHSPWLEAPAEQLQGRLMTWLEQAGEPGSKLKDALHGSWLGHALHPALILAPAHKDAKTQCHRKTIVSCHSRQLHVLD